MAEFPAIMAEYSDILNTAKIAQLRNFHISRAVSPASPISRGPRSRRFPE